MKLLLAVAAISLAVALSGCTTLQQVVNDIGVAKTVYAEVKGVYTGAPKTLFVARAGYDVALTAAAHFKTATCPAVSSHAYCATLIPELRDANHKTLAAFDEAEQFVRTHPTLDATSFITAAETAATAFAKLETDNGVPAS